MQLKSNIQHLIIFLILLFVGNHYVFAQQTVKVGTITTLAVVGEADNTYEWELYDMTDGVNFAATTGNCPETKARFIDDKNIGNTVMVEWLTPGEYFYKINVINNCANNIRVGIIKVESLIANVINAENDNYVVKIGETTTSILNNDSFNGGAIDITKVTISSSDIPAGFTLNADGTIKIDKSVTKGVYTFTYTLCEKGAVPANCDKATVVILVKEDHDSGPNSAPVVDNDIVSIYAGEKEPLDINPPTDADGDKLTIKVKEIPKEGVLIKPDGTELKVGDELTPEEVTQLVYVAPIYYHGDENVGQFVYTVSDGTHFVDGIAKIYVKSLPILVIPQGFSPNNDGVNDKFVIKGIDAYPNTTLKIFNRWGALIYQQRGYQNNWDGRSNNKLDWGDKIVPEGTYYYVLIPNKNSKLRQFIKGYIYINY